MDAKTLKQKWHKDIGKDDIREMVVEDNVLKRLEEKNEATK